MMMTPRTRKVTRLLAMLVVLLLLAPTATAMAMPGAFRTTKVEVSLFEHRADKVRAYVDTADWPIYLHDIAHSGSTTSPVPVDNETIWEINSGTAIPTSPVISSNILVYATAGGSAYGLNASTGAELWSVNLGSANPSTPAIWNGHVLFGMLGGDLVCLALNNGTKEWSIALGGTADTTPIAAEGTVYIGTGAAKVWAYNITDGKHIWNRTVAGPIGQSLAMSGTVLVLTSGNTIQALNNTNGNIIWTNTTAGVTTSGPSIGGTSSDSATWLTFVGSSDNKLYAFNMTNGGMRWSSVINFKASLVPTLNSKVVVVSGTDRLQGYNTTNGNRFWNHTTPTAPITSAAISNWTLVVGTQNGLEVLSFGTGASLTSKWAYAIKNLNAPALAYGRAFITTSDGMIIAFGHRSTAVIDLITPDPVAQDRTVNLKGHGIEAPAFVNYRWTSNIDGVLAEGSTKANAAISVPLSLGVHTVSFEVQDDNWTWSKPVTAQFSVKGPVQWPMFRSDTDRTGLTEGTVPGTNGTKWAFDLTGPTENQDVQSSPIIVGDLTIIGTRDFFIHAINTTTGMEAWSFKTGGSVDSTPAYSGGYIYFGSGDTRVYCMDADPSDGIDEGTIDFGASYDLVWTYDTNGPIWSSPAVVNNVVYVTTSPAVDPLNPNPGRLYALKAGTANGNRELWHFTLPNNAPSYSSPLVYGDLIFFGANDNRLYAINRWTGKEAWNLTTGDSIQSSPAASNGLVYFGSNDWKVYAVYHNNGTVAWSKPTGAEVKSSPAVSNGMVYIGGMDNKLYALNATTGAQSWAFDTGDGIWSSPAVSHDQVVFGSYDGYVYVVNTTSHGLTWKKNMLSVAQSSPAIANEMIVIGAANGYIYSFGKAPDLSVDAKDITFSLATPQVGVPITIKATVYNKGTVHGNGTVGFYDEKDGIATSLGSGLVDLDPGNFTTLSVQWVPATQGFHLITVNITGIVPYDSSSSNNKAQRSATVQAQTEGWRMFHKDAQHTGLSDVPAPNNNKLLWSYTFNGAIRASPIVADPMVYLATINGIYALAENPKQPTGIPIWNNTTIKNLEATPAVVNGILYVASMDGSIYAIDAWSGKTLWSKDIAAGPSSPVVHNGTLFVGTTTGKLVAIGAMNGTILWNKTLGGQILGSPGVYEDKAVMVGSVDGAQSKITSFNALNGAERWSFSTGYDVISSPTLDADGYVYISDTNGTIYKFEAVPDFKDDGIPNSGPFDIIWTYSTGLPIRSTIGLSGNNIYLTAGNTTMISLTTNGELNWKRIYTGDENRVLMSSPSISQNKIFVGGDMIYCLDKATGLKVWSYDPGATVSASPAIILGQVFFVSEKGSVYAFANITPISPKAVISSPQNNGNYRIGGQITFDASASTDDGVILDYIWDFGDGSTGEGMVVKHSYDNVENYTISLTVKDNELTPLSNTTYATIHVLDNSPPSLATIGLTPTEGYDTQVYNFSITYSDPDNDHPEYVKVSINGIDYFMKQVYQEADDYISGVRFYCSTQLPSGNYTYKISASDGIVPVWIVGVGPKVWRIKEFVKDEVTVRMEYIGQGGVTIELPTLEPNPPIEYVPGKGNISLLKRHIIRITPEDITEWKWMSLEINGKVGNITTGVIQSSLSIWWYNGTWNKLETQRNLNDQTFWINVTSSKTPTLGILGLYGLPEEANQPPSELKVTITPSKSVNVKQQVTLLMSATVETVKGEVPYFKVNWTDKTKDQDSGWSKNTSVSHKFLKKGTYRIVVSASDDPRVLNKAQIKDVDPSHILTETYTITVREEGSSEALIILVVIILVVLAVAFAVPIKGGKDEDEEEDGIEEEQEVKPDDDEEKGTGKDEEE